jgi:hypothetical protein
VDLDGKFAKSGPDPDVEALAAMRALLHQLIGQSADVLGIDRVQLDELRANRLINRDHLRRWPRMPREGVDVQGEVRQRLQLLRDLNRQARALGLDLALGGEVPPETPP